MLLVTAAVIIGAVAVMFVKAGDEFDTRINRQVDRVQGDFNNEVNRLDRRIQRRLDERLPATPTPAP
jgi:sensor domain CHASE-containing protein